jgi:hypothetical protein
MRGVSSGSRSILRRQQYFERSSPSSSSSLSSSPIISRLLSSSSSSTNNNNDKLIRPDVAFILEHSIDVKKMEVKDHLVNTYYFLPMYMFLKSYKTQHYPRQHYLLIVISYLVHDLFMDTIWRMFAYRW